MFRIALMATAIFCSGFLLDAHSQTTREATRGELLYTTHCIACHSTQVHWRDKKIATNWTSLQAQVRRWQEFSGLGWRDQDIAEVAQYLNTSIYRYPAPN